MEKTNNFDAHKNTEELLKAATWFQTESEKARKLVLETYLKNESEPMNSFRVTIDGLLARMSNQLLQVFENPDEKISYQLSLVASFIRSHFLTTDLIMQGDLIEAMTLVRKQLEMLTRLHEIDGKPIQKLLKKTPNVINIFGKAGKEIYPTLSEIAHFATPRVGDLIDYHSDADGRSGPGLMPFYNENCFNCYKQHAYVSIYFSVWLTEFLKRIYGEKYDSINDEKTFYVLMKIAQECDIVTLMDDDKK